MIEFVTRACDKPNPAWLFIFILIRQDLTNGTAHHFHSRIVRIVQDECYLVGLLVNPRYRTEDTPNRKNLIVRFQLVQLLLQVGPFLSFRHHEHQVEETEN